MESASVEPQFSCPQHGGDGTHCLGHFYGKREAWYGLPRGSSGKNNLPANAGDVRDEGSTPGREEPLEEGMAAHSMGGGLTRLLTLSCLEGDRCPVHGPSRTQPLPSPTGTARRAQLSQLASSAPLRPELCLHVFFRAQLLPWASGSGSPSLPRSPPCPRAFSSLPSGPLPSSPQLLPSAS